MSDFETVQPQSFRSLKGLLIESVQRVKARYRFILPILIVFALVWAWPTLISQSGHGNVGASSSAFLDALNTANLTGGYGFIVVVAITLILLGMSQIVNLSLMSALSGDKGKPARISIWDGARLFWSSLLLAILSAVTVLGGLTLLVVPGIILSLWFVFSPAVLVTEGRSGIVALERSKELVSGRVVSIFWRIFAMSIIVFVGQLLLSLLGQVTISKTIGNVLSSLGNTFLFYPISTAFFMLMLEDAVKAKPADRFTPSKKDRNWFIGIAIFGVLVLIALVIFVPSIFNSIPAEYQGA